MGQLPPTSLKHVPVDELLQLPFFQNRGAHFLDRALVDDEQGERELIFSNTIKRQFERTGFPAGFHKSETKEQAVFTMFQWLITNCGKSCLEEALNECGLEIVKK